ILDAPLPSEPGQFVMAWLPDVGEKPFSISGNDPLTLTVCDVGPVSRALCALQPGERVWARGPLGKGFVLTGTSHILVGGGYGAAPLSFLARQARALGHKVVVCLGAKTHTELMLSEQFKDMGCEVLAATEDGSAGVRGRVTALYRPQDFDVVVACGPVPMMRAVQQACRDAGTRAVLSMEARMACGIGACLGCTTQTTTGMRRVCTDGPVFPADEVIFDDR
ncbi:MAG TPA: dihydroorotate dehydrogenase electron transfer subunit, partial [Myxococcota bacterium]|nr:dihydroorotate dehydrogenase electron transfer subunit [Myxococcota bacterium]